MGDVRRNSGEGFRGLNINGKIWIFVRRLAVMAAGFLLWGTTAAAAGSPTVELTAEGSQAAVELKLSSKDRTGQSDYDQVQSLQLGFQVNVLQGEGEDHQISFLFDDGLTCGVKQYTYQEETGLLQIYLSGAQNLFEGDNLVLGNILLETAGSSGVTASIRPVEDSMKVVNDAFALQQLSLEGSKTVQVTAEGGSENGSGDMETGSDEMSSENEKGSQEDSSSGNMETDSEESALGETPTDSKDDVKESGLSEGEETGGTEKQAGEEKPEESGSPADEEKTAGETEEINDGEPTEQKPLLRLVRTEKSDKFSLSEFFSFPWDRKTWIFVGVGGGAAMLLVVGAITRAVHNRRKKKKWW